MKSHALDKSPKQTNHLEFGERSLELGERHALDESPKQTKHLGPGSVPSSLINTQHAVGIVALPVTCLTVAVDVLFAI